MNERIDRRQFIKTAIVLGGITVLPLQFPGCNSEISSDFLYTPDEYDIFYKFKIPRNLVKFDLSNLKSNFPKADDKEIWMIQMTSTIFQGLINRKEPRIWLQFGNTATDWLEIYGKEGITIQFEEESDYASLIKRFANELDGYIVIDPEMLHSINVAQTWGSLENWMVITPEMESLVKETGLKLREDLRGRWTERVEVYEWAFKNLFSKCSKHIIANYCVDYPYGGHFVDRDFTVANKSFIIDLSAALRQRKEYRLMDKIYAKMEFPSGVWGWHDTRDHEHWAVERASRKGIYTICSGMPNMSVHGGIKPNDTSLPKQKESTRKSLVAEKDKIYIAFIMSDGDAFWVIENQQNRNWNLKEERSFPVSWGFQPLLADVAPAVYKYYIDNQKPTDYMFCGPAGAGYTYTYQHPDPRKFLRMSKHYMQRCDLNIPYITNWNDYSNWQEVDVPEFNPILFKELNNSIGFIRGMGESAFEPNYNFEDKPYIFCGEGLHVPDKDDVATVRNFIEANPNRPLFIPIIINVSVSMERITKITTDLKQYNIDYVRLDDFIYLIKNAYKQGLITEVLYPNREGNKRILSAEAPGQWEGTKSHFEKLAPILFAKTEIDAIMEMNKKEAGLALGQEITDEDKTDILAFELCKNMFSLAKNILNYKGVYVNKRIDSVNELTKIFSNWAGVDSLPKLVNIWQNWDDLTLEWNDIVATGQELHRLAQEADKLISKG